MAILRRNRYRADHGNGMMARYGTLLSATAKLYGHSVAAHRKYDRKTSARVHPIIKPATASGQSVGSPRQTQNNS